MTATEESPLLIDVQNGVARLTMNRPQRLNALNEPMIRQAIAALTDIAHDPAVGCVLLTGAGKGFCAGGDVTMMSAGPNAELTHEQQVDRQRDIHTWARLLYEMPKITIAAVNGACAGAGFGLALACDLRLASSAARFITAFAKVGFSGDFGITWPLARLLGEAKAKELLFFSEQLSAEQACALGLVSRVVAPEALLDEAQALAQRLAGGPRLAYRYIKENIRAAATETYAELLDREGYTQRRCAATADHREGVAAFMEKRAPRFSGS